jgi:hypothetical protein
MATRMRRAPVAGGVFLALVLLLALALIFTGMVGGNGQRPAIADAGCSIHAKVKPYSHFPAAFASQYTKKLRVTVYNRTGNVKTWHLELYTFSGTKLGRSKERHYLTYGTRAAINLRRAMQPGPYTVVVKGEIPGCGPVEVSSVIHLRPCLGKLPIQFFNKPRGTASDYGKYLSIGIQPRSGWDGTRQIHSVLADFDGIVYGRATLPKGFKKLFGQQFLNHKLNRKLQKGGYSVTVTGKAPQPIACGNKVKSTTLKFK